MTFETEFSEQTCPFYTSTRPSLVEMSPNTYFAFGGFHLVTRKSSNESVVIKIKERKSIKFRFEGTALPLPRSGASTALVSINNSALTGLSPDEEKKEEERKGMILAFGCFAFNFVDDFDLLLIHHRSPPDELAALFNKEEFHDMVIKVGEEKIFAHKIILSSRSLFFRQLLDTFKARECDILIFPSLLTLCPSE